MISVLHFVWIHPQPSALPNLGFRYALPVPTVKWVHFLYLNPLGVHTIFYRSYRMSVLKNWYLQIFGLRYRLCTLTIPTSSRTSTVTILGVWCDCLANKKIGLILSSDGIFWHAPAECCWHRSFAGVTFISKTMPAKFKMRQQNFRHASKIINPNEFCDMPRKQKLCKINVGVAELVCVCKSS